MKLDVTGIRGHMAKKTVKEVKTASKVVEKPEKAKKPPVKRVVLTDRQKFHKWYNEEYLKDVSLDELHHCDKHSMLGYETNTFMHEIQTVKGKIEHVACRGLCPLCTTELPSAREEYANR